MPTISIPENTKRHWEVSNFGDWFGHIIKTFNITLHLKEGYIFNSQKVYPYTTNQDIANMGMAVDFEFSNFDGQFRYWAVCDDGKLYKSADLYDLFSNFAVDTLTNSPTDLTENSDIVIHDRTTSGYDIVVVSRPTDLARFNRDVSTTTWKNNWWTDTLGQPALQNGVPHPLEVFGKLLLIGDANLLHSVDTTGTVNNSRIVFSNNYIINWIKATKDRIFIGLKNIKGSEYPSEVAEYDPFSETIRLIEIQEGETIGYIQDNNLWIIDGRGYIAAWNGYGFIKKFYIPIAMIGNNAYIRAFRIALPHRNGIMIKKGRPHFLLPGGSSSPYYYYSGIWVYEPETERFYHKYSLTFSKTTLNSFGETGNFYGGALYALPDYSSAQGFLAGASLPNVNIAGIFSTVRESSVTVSDSTRGHFVLAKIPANDIDNFWKNILIKYSSRFFPCGKMPSGSIIVKYRISEPSSSLTDYAATWVDATHFTINASALTNVEIGDEVFVWRGQGAGMTAHITNITGTNPKTVTIDEGLSVTPSGTFRVVFDNWKKLGVLTDDNKSWDKLDLPISTVSSWIQFKIELRDFWGIEQIQIGYQPNLLLEK